MSKEICHTCFGTGVLITKSNIETCTACDGVGYFETEAKDGSGTQTGEEAPSLTGQEDKSGQR